MKNVRTLAVLNFLAYLMHIIFAFLTQFKLVNKQNVAEVSSKYESLFTPAPLTFAIWGIIYTALAAFCIYHLVMAFKWSSSHHANHDVARIDGWFIVNNFAAAAWLVSWTWDEIGMALSFMVLQLICLIVINLRLGTYSGRTAKSILFTQLPLGLYFGWITIATIANVTAYLVSISWDAFGLVYTASQWTIIVVSLAVIIACLVVTMRRNIWYGLAVIWGLYGISVRLSDIDFYEYSAVIHTIWGGMGLIAIMCLFRLILNVSFRKHDNEEMPGPRIIKPEL